MVSKYWRLLLHFFGIIAFLSIPIITSPDIDSGIRLLVVSPFQRAFLTYVFLLVFFYTNFYVLIPQYYFKRKYLFYVIFIIISFYIVLNVPQWIIPDNPLHHPPPNIPKPSFGNPNQEPLFDGFGIISFSLILALSFLLKINAQLIDVNNEKLKAEVSYLKAQINPHFLFNTLNSLYALSLEKSDDAPEAVLKLSTIMRYMVTESTEDFVSLVKEMDYISDYIALQKLRINEDTKLDFTIKGNPAGKVIAPLILIQFIENAFKYGINPDKDSRIDIRIDIEEDTIGLIVKNEMTVDDISEELKTAKGIENTSKRLHYIYPNKHTLAISQKENIYEVNLKINIQ